MMNSEGNGILVMMKFGAYITTVVVSRSVNPKE